MTAPRTPAEAVAAVAALLLETGLNSGTLPADRLVNCARTLAACVPGIRDMQAALDQAAAYDAARLALIEESAARGVVVRFPDRGWHSDAAHGDGAVA